MIPQTPHIRVSVRHLSRRLQPMALLLVSSLFILIGLVGRPAAAQDRLSVIEGTITDSDGGIIPGVNVRIEGTDRGTAADQDGHYRLKQLGSGVVVLRFSAVGFHAEMRTVRLEAGSTTVLNVTLSWKTILSDEVIVTASRREQPALSVPVSVSVLGRRPEPTKHRDA